MKGSGLTVVSFFLTLDGLVGIWGSLVTYLGLGNRIPGLGN